MAILPAIDSASLDRRESVVASETKVAGNTHQPLDGNDSSISFEEFVYWAERTRADEKLAQDAVMLARGKRTLKSTVRRRFSRGQQDHRIASEAVSESTSQEETITGVSEREWKQASRALRTATWGSIFYLVTTDVLGPFSTPWAFAQMGYGPGVALYTVFGAMAG